MTRDLRAASREPSGPTTLSSLAHSGSVAAPRSRLGLIVGASAIVVGGAIGSALALRTAPASAGAAPASRTPSAAALRAGTQTAAVGPGATSSTPAGPGAPASAAAAPAAGSAPSAAVPHVGMQPVAAAPGAASSPAPGAPTSAAGAPPAVRPSPSPEVRAALAAQIKDTLRRFVAWSHAHPGARCPDAAALGAALDPWGQPLRIVCSDQPADQVAGVLSYGPDGEPGTRDDVVSWALGADVTDLARGPRWSASRGMAAAAGTGRHGGGRPGPRTNPATPPLAAGAAPPATVHVPPRPAAAGAGSNDTDGDGIPDRR
jgi:hypothetical protein